MDDVSVNQALRNLDERTQRIEQILPTLATREELHEAIRAAVEPLPTREEMREAIRAAVEPLPTREEMREAIRVAVEPLATREELRAVSEEGKRHTTMLFEHLRADIRLLAEHVAGLMNRPSL